MAGRTPGVGLTCPVEAGRGLYALNAGVQQVNCPVLSCIAVNHLLENSQGTVQRDMVKITSKLCVYKVIRRASGCWI